MDSKEHQPTFWDGFFTGFIVAIFILMFSSCSAPSEDQDVYEEPEKKSLVLTADTQDYHIKYVVEPDPCPEDGCYPEPMVISLDLTPQYVNNKGAFRWYIAEAVQPDGTVEIVYYRATLNYTNPPHEEGHTSGIWAIENYDIVFKDDPNATESIYKGTLLVSQYNRYLQAFDVDERFWTMTLEGLGTWAILNEQ